MTAAATSPAELVAESPDQAPFARVAALFRPHLGLVVSIVAVATVQGIANVASPFFLRAIIDRALPERSASLVTWLAGAMICCALLSAALTVYSTRLASTAGQRVMHDLRVRVFTHLQRMSLRFFTRTRAGELQSRMANDIGGVDNVVTSTASGTVQSVIGALTVAIAALIMNWRLGVLCLVVVPIFLLFSLRLGRTRRGITRGRQRKMAGLTALVEESLSVAGVLLTKTMGRQEQQIERFRTESEQLSHTEVQLAMAGRWQLSSRRAALTMIPAIVYWIAGMAVSHGAAPVTIGTAVGFTSMLNRLVSPATALQGIGSAFSTSMALFGRIFEVLDLPVDVPERAGAQRLDHVRGEVTFEHVSFRYDPDSDWTLRDVCFSVPPGTTTALVGSTGAGKTTTGYLVGRLYDVDEGAVCIDGVDVRDVQSAALSEIVGLVAQDTYLFHDTVRDNLLFAAPDATTEQLDAACRVARIDELIKGLPEGYDTLVGARGYRFSGGERQRLAIARMVLRNPPVLVLDEATSSLDTETERAVQAALEELAAGRTTIAIAHRMSTVRHADQIVVLEHGRVVERGRHEELLAAGGRYATLAVSLDS